MAQYIFILYLLSLLLFVNGVPFDFFQLVQQWGPNTCSRGGIKCYAQPQPMFTIHGLWPTNFSTVPISCATKKQFPKSQVTNIQQDLNKYWPDVINGPNNFNFWEHEWKKHGACIDPPFTTFWYFDISLKHRMNKTYDLLAILNDAGLSHQMPKDLISQDVLDPIKNATEMEPGIRCNINGITGKLQLHEIVLCFDNGGTTLIDCPSFVSNTGRNQPKFVWLLPQQSSVGVPDYP